MPGTAPTLIALVDLVRLIKETPEGRIMGAKAKGMFDEKQKRLDDMQEDVKKRIEAFKRERGSLSPEAVAKGEASFQQEVTRIQSVYKTYQKELGDSQAELGKKLIDGTIAPRLRALALASGSPTVLDAKAVAYFQRELDLTESAATRATSVSLKPVRIARMHGSTRDCGGIRRSSSWLRSLDQRRQSGGRQGRPAGVAGLFNDVQQLHDHICNQW